MASTNPDPLDPRCPPAVASVVDAAVLNLPARRWIVLRTDLSSLGDVNTVFAALFSKLVVPIKTSVSATILEEALNGRVSVDALVLGQAVSKKVEKQCAHFYAVTITEDEVSSGEGSFYYIYCAVVTVLHAYEEYDGSEM